VYKRVTSNGQEQVVYDGMIASNQMKGVWSQDAQTGRWNIDMGKTMLQYNISKEHAEVIDFAAQKMYDHLVDSLLLHDIGLRQGKSSEKNIYALIENEYTVKNGIAAGYSATARQTVLLDALDALRVEMRKGVKMEQYAMGFMPSLSQKPLEVF
jgi:hypothetical protein